MNNFLLGWSIASTLGMFLSIFFLSRKTTTVNEINRLRQVSRRNRGSNINNTIEPKIETNEPKKGLFKNKRKKKKT